MQHVLSRRGRATIFAACCGSATWAHAGALPTSSSVATVQPMGTVFSEVIVAQQPQRYIGWPTIITAGNGDLLAAFSGDRDAHVDPWGKIYTVRSSDGGQTWQEPVLVADTPLDDRGSGLELLPDGSILMSFEAATSFDDPVAYPQYQAYANSLTPEVRAQWKGYWGLRSQDNGLTWGPYKRMPAMIPHGPTALDNGRLLLVGGGPVFESTNKGETWTLISTIVKNPATWNSRYAFMSEPVSVQTADGRLLALTRYADGNDIELRQTESSDGGRTWTEPHKTGMRGYPADLMRLNNGWLVATYGLRLDPIGERASVSMDNGHTWLTNYEIVLSHAVPQGVGHMGYPSSTVAADGSIWSVYYQIPEGNFGVYPALMGTHWQLSTTFSSIAFYDSVEGVNAGAAPSALLGSYMPAYTTNSVVKTREGTNSLGHLHPIATGGGTKMLLIDRPGNIGRRHMGLFQSPITAGRIHFDVDLMNEVGWISFGFGSDQGGVAVVPDMPMAIYITIADNGNVMVYDPGGSGWTTIAGLSNTVGQWQHYALDYQLGAEQFTLSAGGNSVVLDAFGRAGLTSVSQIKGFGILGGTTTAVGYADNIMITVAANAAWDMDGGGSWSQAINWTGGVPNSIAAVANFGTVATAAQTVTVDGSPTVGALNFASPNAYRLAGVNPITLNVWSGQAQINVTDGSHTISAPVVLNKDTTITTAASTGIALTGDLSATGKTITKAGAGTVQFENLRTTGLIVNEGQVQIRAKALANDPAGTSVLTSLGIAPGASLDLNNNSAVLDYTTLGTLVDDTRLMLAYGRLISSEAGGKLGYADNAVLHLTSFAGQIVDDTNLLIKFTYGGDANLDGQVDISDLGSLATAWQTNNVWTGGDFDYSGFVDISDLGILATHWQGGTAHGLDQALQSRGLSNTLVPEPAAFVALLTPLAMLARRRRGTVDDRWAKVWRTSGYAASKTA